MIKEAIILAGGLGTRLQSVVSDVPKCMAPVAGKPFLHYVIEYLRKNEIEKFVFSLGYKHEVIEKYLDHYPSDISYEVSIETEPLGTGGAIKLAGKKCSEKNVLICNGDTLFKVNLEQLTTLHEEANASCTLALKPMQYFDRYGVVELDENQKIISFKEKQYYISGLINGGLYALHLPSFQKEDLPEKFSFEKDYLEKAVKKKLKTNPSIFGLVQDEYFIDIGIPEDYEKAQHELQDQP